MVARDVFFPARLVRVPDNMTPFSYCSLFLFQMSASRARGTAGGHLSASGLRILMVKILDYPSTA